MKLEKEVYIDKINELSNMNICFNEPFTLKEIETLKKIAIKRKVKLTLEYQEPILDEEERKYLRCVIRPFKDRIISITKVESSKYERINIIYTNIQLVRKEIKLPLFEKDKMYKGMELNKKYTLKELGL